MRPPKKILKYKIKKQNTFSLSFSFLDSFNVILITTAQEQKAWKDIIARF